MNSKGQLIITDILFYLVMLVIILSLIVYATSILNDNQVSRINNRQLNNILEDTLSALTQTSGTPTNWEYHDTKDIKSIGLKSDNSQLISYTKLVKLKNNPELLYNYFPQGVSYTLTLYPKDNPNNIQLIAGSNYLNNKKQVQSKSMTAIIDYEYDITSLSDNMKSCPYNHDRQWQCTAFTITDSILSNGQYYIVTDSQTEYILSNTYSYNITGQTNNKVNINKQLKQLKINENQTIVLHIKNTTNNTCLVYDSNNREKFLESVTEPEIYVLTLKVAT